MPEQNDSYGQALMIAELQLEEALRLKIYTDTRGFRTIGIGRNLDSVGISAAEAYALCANDLAAAEAQLDRNAPWWRAKSPVRQRVLLDMAFNLGWSGLSQFKTFLLQLQADQYEDAATSMLHSLWATQVGARATRLSAMMRSGLPPTGITTA